MGNLKKRTYPSGRVSYTYRYYYNDRYRRITFGPVLKRKAEEWYHEAETLLRRGIDPREHWDVKGDHRTTGGNEAINSKSRLLSNVINNYINTSLNKGNRPLISDI